MKIREIVTLVNQSINPNLESDKVWNLYSLPSFDAGKQCEVVLGSVIQSNKFIVPNKCILFNKLNVRFKRIWQIDNELPSKICSTEFLPLVVNEDKADFNFTYYLLQSNIITNYLCGQNQSTSNSHKRIDVDNFFEIDVSVPDLPVQRKIAAVLSALDNKIEVSRRINEKLEQMAKRLFDYWFVQFDFPNEEGKPYKSSGGAMVYNSVLKRAIPAGWKNGSIGDLFQSQPGFAFKSSDWKSCGHPVLTIGNINSDGSINMHKTSFIEKYDLKYEKWAANNGNMVFAMSGNTIGKIGVIASPHKNILINQRVLIVKTTTSNVAFPYFVINNPLTQKLVFQLGANSAQPNISEDELRSIKICLPSLPYMESFNQKCAGIFQLIINNRIVIDQLTALRDELLPLLMNGQVTVK